MFLLCLTDEELRQWDIKELAKGHLAVKWLAWDSSPGRLSPLPLLLLFISKKKKKENSQISIKA